MCWVAQAAPGVARGRMELSSFAFSRMLPHVPVVIGLLSGKVDHRERRGPRPGRELVQGQRQFSPLPLLLP